MKILNHRGHPILNNTQAVHQQEVDEGLLEIDLEELYLLLECGDVENDVWDDIGGF